MGILEKIHLIFQYQFFKIRINISLAKSSKGFDAHRYITHSGHKVYAICTLYANALR